MGVSIRRVKDEEIPEVAALQESFLREHAREYDQDFYALTEHARESWISWARGRIDDQSFCLLVADDGGTIAGYVSGWIETRPPIYLMSEIGYLSNLYVASSYRGTGVGSALNTAILKWFHAKEVVIIELTTDARATGSVAFWQALGYREVRKSMRFRLRE